MLRRVLPWIGSVQGTYLSNLSARAWEPRRQVLRAYLASLLRLRSALLLRYVLLQQGQLASAVFIARDVIGGNLGRRSDCISHPLVRLQDHLFLGLQLLDETIGLLLVGLALRFMRRSHLGRLNPPRILVRWPSDVLDER